MTIREKEAILEVPEKIMLRELYEPKRFIISGKKIGVGKKRGAGGVQKVG